MMFAETYMCDFAQGASIYNGTQHYFNQTPWQCDIYHHLNWASCALGGSGQYGRVIGYMEPLPEDAPEKVVFAKEIIGNAVPPQFIPSIEKGFLQACNSGTLIGHPVEVGAHWSCLRCGVKSVCCWADVAGLTVWQG